MQIKTVQSRWNGMRTKSYKGAAMNIHRLLSVLLFSLLLTTPPIFFPGQAFAWMCCSCAICKVTPNCVCPGTPGKCPGYACPPGLINDTDHLMVSTLHGDGTVDIQRLIHLTKVNECTRLSYSLRVLGDAGQNLKVETFTANITSSHNTNVEAQLAANSERQ